jgi:pilus assembly protein Flp/PilA
VSIHELTLSTWPGCRSQDPKPQPEKKMKNFAKKVQRFLASEDGPTAVEYAVMLALIVIVCLASIRAVGTNAQQAFTNIAAQIGSTSS